MAALPRSEVSFRRSGSSGLVWDDKYLSGELKPVNTKEGGAGGDHNKVKDEQKQKQAYRTVDIAPAMVDPPSPKLSGCGVCFGKPTKNTHKPTHVHRR